MSSQVVRVQDFTKGSLYGIGAEAERGDVEHRNPDIDSSRSDQNLYFKKTEHGFYAEWNDVKTALNAQFKDSKNSTAFEGMVITSDSEFFKSKFGYENGKTVPAQMKKFFEESYQWAVREIGYQGTDRNIISAVVHLDETTPHLQLYFVPVTDKWQEKVYAKDSQGHVLRTEKGTPIQAKDSTGKTIYNQVQNSYAPKLSRSEFWRIRGGNTSYSQLQDNFNAEIGSRYGLDRGEVGSNKVHRTKSQWEQDQLVKAISPYREMTADIAEVETKGKKVFGKVLIDQKELDVLKEQAKTYRANKEELSEIRQRRVAVREREMIADQRERRLSKREREVEDRSSLVEKMYMQQADLNTYTKAIERERDSLKAENGVLKHEIAKLRENLAKTTNELTERFKGIYERFKGVCQAVGFLEYDLDVFDREKRLSKATNLNKKQISLITAIRNHGIHTAEDLDDKKTADEIRQYIGTPDEIDAELEAIEGPQIRTSAPTQSHHSHFSR